MLNIIIILIVYTFDKKYDFTGYFKKFSSLLVYKSAYLSKSIEYTVGK